MDVAETSNPRYGTKDRKIGCKNTTLMIVEKIGESKVFEGVLMCLNVFRRERIYLETAQKPIFVKKGHL